MSCRVDDTGPPLSWDAHHIRKVAANLEKRWHALWLKSLERQCLIEELLKKYRAGCMPGDPSFELSFSEEPLTKYPKLSNDWEDSFVFRHADKTNPMDSELTDQEVMKDNENMEECLKTTMKDDKCEISEENTNTNDKGVMVGMTGIADLKAECGSNIGRFEIIQDVGYSSESSAHLSNDERQEFIRVYSYSPVCSGPSLISEYAITNQITEKPDNKPSSSNLSNLYLPPDKYPSISLKEWQFASGEEPFYKLKNKTESLTTPTSTFYKMTSIDPDAVEDCSEPLAISENEFKDKNDINDENFKQGSLELMDNDDNSNPLCPVLKEDSNLSANDLATSVTQVQSLSDATKLQQLLTWAEVPNKNSFVQLKDPHSGKKLTRNAQIREWLQNCQENKNCDKIESSIENKGVNNHLLVDSSCDASGEYTTNESDSEQSSSSADINNSLVMSRSNTGSVETVIPVVEEVSGNVESFVTMRNKRKSFRDRPWSVTEIGHITSGMRFSPLSTSEGSLNILCASQYNKGSDSRNRTSKWSMGMQKNTSDDKNRLPVSTAGSKPKRNRSRSSLQNSSHRSDSGSDNLSPNTTCSTLCQSQCSDLVQFSTPTRRRKSNIILSDKFAIHLSPVHRRLSNPRSSISNNSNTKKRNSQSSYDVCQKSESWPITNSEPENLTSPHLPSSSVADSDQALTQTEDQSSVSDQVWDGYQDPPYFSEPYSEQALNEEEVRKLIEFGDDYGAYLGCHSDASSFSDGRNLNNRMHLSHSRSQSFVSTSTTEVIDSDSDMEDLQDIFAQSTRHLQKAKNTFNRNQAQNDVPNFDYAELYATCETHLNCLQVISDHFVKGDKTNGNEDFGQLTNLIEEWKSLRQSIASKQKSNCEKQHSAEYLAIQKSLNELAEKITQLTTTPLQRNTTLDLLQERIAALQMSRSTLQETKDSLLEVSKRIVRLMSDADLLTCPLKEHFKQLYQKWEDIYEENGTHLTDLQQMYQKWNNCDALCQQLQKTLEASRTSEVNKEIVESAERQLDKLRTMLAEVKDLLGTGEPWKKLAERVADLQSKIYVRDVSCAPVHTEKSRPTKRFWRIIRFAIPIQFALVLLYCLACLLEPRCCDLVNNLNFSLTPHLRYVRGPPPV